MNKINALILVVLLLCSLGARYQTDNFLVVAATPEIAQQVGDAAETHRKALAVEWLGEELPRWAQPCPVTVSVGANLGPGGQTKFLFDRGEVYGWRMNVQGSLERVLDSVLPHEISHTIFASHFRQPLPRWADEGACGTVEHASEQSKYRKTLVQCLKTGRGIPFATMLPLCEYPQDVMPLYAQGHSLSTFLIAHHSRPHFVNYIGDGLKGDWPKATQAHYGYRGIGELQNTWLDWVQAGSPIVERTAGYAGTTFTGAGIVGPFGGTIGVGRTRQNQPQYRWVNGVGWVRCDGQMCTVVQQGPPTVQPRPPVTPLPSRPQPDQTAAIMSRLDALAAAVADLQARPVPGPDLALRGQVDQQQQQINSINSRLDSISQTLSGTIRVVFQDDAGGAAVVQDVPIVGGELIIPPSRLNVITSSGQVQKTGKPLGEPLRIQLKDIPVQAPK